MKKFVLVVLVLALVGGGVYVAGTYHFVNTDDGIKMYPKRSFSFLDTYVDMKNMSFIELRNHLDLIAVMTSQGDLEYLPGGETLEDIARMGESVIDAVSKFDSEYQISDSLEEIGRIGLEKWGEVDEQYDISGKAKQASDYIQEKAQDAGDYLQDKADELNDWLKSR